MGKYFSNFKVPHAFALLTFLILVCSIASYVIPSGKYEKKIITVGSSQKTVLVPGSFKYLPKKYEIKDLLIGNSLHEGYATPVSILQFLTAIPKGMATGSAIIFFIFIVGGAFGILNETGTITAILQSLIKKFAHKRKLLIITVMIVTGLAGSCFGLGEELLPLIPVFLLLSIRLGYDRMFGFCLVYLASSVGFAAATTNPFTLQVAQGIAGLPLCSGIILRIIFFACAISLLITYVLLYGKKIVNNHSVALLGEEGFHMGDAEVKHTALNKRHVIVIITSLLIFAFLIYGTQAYGWFLNEMAGGFILVGICAAIISKLSIEVTTRAFIKGLEGMVVAALVVGFATGLQVVLEEAQIIDTIIHSADVLLKGLSSYLAAIGMLVFQTVLNFFIPSGSGQAAVTMPLMAPLSDVLHVTRQTAVLAFTCGDGFSNAIIPTSGMLMAALSIANIPYEKYFKFVFPIFIMMMFLSVIFLSIAVAISY